MQVALAVAKSSGGEQYLAGEQALGCQSVLVDAHESRLADRRQGLKASSESVRYPPSGAYRRDAGGDRTRGDDHDRVASRRKPATSLQSLPTAAVSTEPLAAVTELVPIFAITITALSAPTRR